MKRTAIVRRTPLLNRTPLTSASSLRRSPLVAVSRKRAGQNRTYTTLRARFLTDHARCEFPHGCTEAASEVHHRKGRVGRLLLDVNHWSALCHDHHQHVTEHPAEAYVLGISERRIGGTA